ncbi:MAG TPA: hypothetical protein VGK84_02975 [Candidatus Tumulicola sp.]|jgi:hypothetical protein
MLRAQFHNVSRALLTASILALAACSAPTVNSGGVPVTAQPATTSELPPAKTPKAMLYVSDSGTNQVDVFNWPKPNAPIGTLSGLSEPQGQCADQSGNVFITNTGDENILEYKGTQLTNTLEDPQQYPVGCSYDAVNGNLATANIMGSSDTPGSVAIFAHATGTPEIKAVAGIKHVFSVQYDGSGDLYAYGQNASYKMSLAKLPAGSKKFRLVCANLLSSTEITGIGWDGKHLIFGVATGVDRIENCKIAGFTRLLGPVGVYILGHRLIAMSDSAVAVYAYPKGGFPVQTYTLSGLSEPIGFAISR